VCEKRVLRRISEPRRDDAVGCWAGLHNLFSLPSRIRMMKRRRMRWSGHVALIREKRNACRVLVGIPKEMRGLESQRDE
jgi:hypothetical protein